jgi:WD repeat/SOCS box-containing protein 1
MGPGHPFSDDVNVDSLAQAHLIDQLTSVHNNVHSQKAGCETWACAWSPDGSYFAWSCGNRIVRLVPWNRHKHTTVFSDAEDIDGQYLDQQPVVIDAGELVWAVAFGSSVADTNPRSITLNWWRYKVAKDLVLATGLKSGRIRTWDVTTGQLLLELVDHRDVIRDLRFAPDGSMRLLSASRDGLLKMWDLQDDGNMYATLKTDSKWLYACGWSPDAKMLVSVGSNKSVILWDTDSMKRIRKLDGHYHDVCSCDFSPDGALLATSSYDTRVIVWDPYTGDKLMELRHMYPQPSPIYAGGANGSYVRGVNFSHDGRHIASVCDDMYLRFWDSFDPASPEQVASVSNSLCCSYSPDGAVLAVGTRNGSVSFWLSPMQVSSLQHLCRMAIRRVVPSTKVDGLFLPSRLKSFIRYQEHLCA